MDIRKFILFFHLCVFFFLLTCHHHLATESVNGSTEFMRASMEWIEQQINGTVNVCQDILGANWKNNTNKTLHPNMSELFNVCVPKKSAFPEFIDISKDGKVKGGFSIAIFCLVLQELPFKIQPIFKPIENESYTEVVKKLEGKDCVAVAGDVTITSNRTKYADFTIAYMSSEIYMLVPAILTWKQTMLTLLRPFTMRLWIAIITACIIIGITIGYLEYRQRNPSFYNVPFNQKLYMIIWFPLSKIFFQEGEIRNGCSKFVLVTWLMAIFIVMQIFTACLSSWLTLNQLQPKVPKQYKEVGYQSGSYIFDFVEDHAQSSGTTATALALSSMDDYKNSLDNGTVDAIYDEDPYINIFLAKYGDNYMKIGPLVDEPGLGFAFSRESPLQQKFSNAIVKVTESPEMAQMKNKYLGIQTPPTTQPAEHSVPQSLDVQSFFLLFLLMGLATIMAIIISEISLMRAHQTSNVSREMVTRSGNSMQNVQWAVPNRK